MSRNIVARKWRGIIDNRPKQGHAGIEIADVYGADPKDTRGPVSFTEAKANAQLITAAPALLNMLRAMLDRLETNNGALELGPVQQRSWAAKFRAVITKATTLTK